MNVENPQTCEECLGLLTGVEIPKTRSTKLQDFGYKLDPNDATILISIARQLSKGIAFTDRQYNLVKNKLVNYEDQFDEKGIDVFAVSQNLLYELRDIDRSHWIKILRFKDEDILGIRFPFNKKVISHIEQLRKLNKVKDLAYKDNTHYFPFNANNLYTLVKVARRFENKFNIQKDILEMYNDIEYFDTHRDEFVPGIYNGELKNVPEVVVNNLLKELGSPQENLLLYFDRRHLYGLYEFECNTITPLINQSSTIIQKIVNRDAGAVILNKESFTFNQVVQALFELKRFPVLIVLDEKDAHNDIVETYNSFRNVLDPKDISVMFRQDGQESEFNDYVRDNNLNNLVANNTKIVYINNTKLPKPLLKAGWIPNCVINYRGKGLGYNKVTQYAQQFDLQIIYEDKTSLGYWDRQSRRYMHGNM